MSAPSIARGFAHSFAVSTLIRGVQLTLAVLLVRALGDAGYGFYVFVSGVALIGGRLGALGWPNLMLRFIPDYQVQGDFARLRGLMAASIRVVALGGVAVAAMLVITSQLLGAEHPLSLGLILGAVLVPLSALNALGRSQLIALGHAPRGLFVDGGAVPLMMVAGLCAGFALGLQITPVGVVLGAVLAGVLALVLAGVWVVPRLPAPMRDVPARAQTRIWMAIAAPTLVGMSAKLMMEKSDILMLAPLGSLADVGLYGAAARLVMVQTMASVILNAVIVPQISTALARGDQARARRLFLSALVVALVLSCPLALIFWGYGGPIMKIAFGAEFAHGGTVLAVLGAAQIFGALSVPASAFLILADRQRLFGALTASALALNIGGNLVLIPAYGALGAAVASLSSMSLLGILQTGLCLNTLRGVSVRGMATG